MPPRLNGLPFELVATIVGRMDVLPAFGRRLVGILTGVPGEPLGDLDERERRIADSVRIQQGNAFELSLTAPLPDLGVATIDIEAEKETMKITLGATDGVFSEIAFVYCEPRRVEPPLLPENVDALPSTPRIFLVSSTPGGSFGACVPVWHAILRQLLQRPLPVPELEEPVRELARLTWAWATGEESGATGHPLPVQDPSAMRALPRTDERQYSEGPPPPEALIQGLDATFDWERWTASLPLYRNPSRMDECWVAATPGGRLLIGIRYAPYNTRNVNDRSLRTMEIEFNYSSLVENRFYWIYGEQVEDLRVPGMNPSIPRITAREDWLQAMQRMSSVTGVAQKDLILYFRILLAKVAQRPGYPGGVPEGWVTSITQGLRDLSNVLRAARDDEPDAAGYPVEGSPDAYAFGARL